MQGKYPLCEKLGLKMYSAHQIAASHPDLMVVSVRQVEELLEWAPVVYGSQTAEYWSLHTKFHGALDTHSARLVLLEPLKKDTAEDILREWIEAVEPFMAANPREVDGSFYQRARKLLESK